MLAPSADAPSAPALALLRSALASVSWRMARDQGARKKQSHSCAWGCKSHASSPPAHPLLTHGHVRTHHLHTHRVWKQPSEGTEQGHRQSKGTGARTLGEAPLFRAQGQQLLLFLALR